LAAAGYAALYALAARGRPWASPRVVLPGLASGVIWGLACVAWFAANERLSLVIAFPLVTLGPGLVSMAVGGLFFGEVRSRREAALLAAAVATFCAAGACLGLSGGAGA
jgi:glucose uptake protein GlcU